MKKILMIAAAVMTLSTAQAQQALPFDVSVITRFDEPWALAFLPDGRFLVSEKKGALRIVNQDGRLHGSVQGIPDVAYGGQGGLGDVVLHPDFESNQLVYLSYAESAPGGVRGAVVARGVLEFTRRGGNLSNVTVLWRQYPKFVGSGHYGHRIAFDDDGYLWITSGDRQKFTPAQDMQSNSGKIIRLHDDGSIPNDNPFVDYFSEEAFVDDIGVYPQIWSLGHRNPLGITFDLDGQLWVVEMGPRGGDELNRIVPRGNYGYPLVSNGEHYDGRPIPNHDTRPEFLEPAVWWTPVISPGNMITYSGPAFPEWQGDLLIAGMSSRAIIRIEIDGNTAIEAERFEMEERIRSVVQGPEGNLWALEDGTRGSPGRLLKLTPR